MEGSGAVHMLDAKFHQCVDGYVAVCLVLTRDVYAIVKISPFNGKKVFLYHSSLGAEMYSRSDWMFCWSTGSLDPSPEIA